MKQIIGGKQYNTDTAQDVANWNNGLGYSDFRNTDETLYRTKNGNYFLHGEGGAMTRWSEGNGNTTWGSSRLIALTPQEALEWLEQHNLDVPDNCPEIINLVIEA